MTATFRTPAPPEAKAAAPKTLLPHSTRALRGARLLYSERFIARIPLPPPFSYMLRAIIPGVHRNMPCDLPSFMQCPAQAFGKPVARLGLASRGDAVLTVPDMLDAFDRGVRFVNVPGLSEGEGNDDAVSHAIATCGSLRDELVVSAQFGARTADEAQRELDARLRLLHIDYIDVLTLYYVDAVEEWDALRRMGGAFDAILEAKRDGRVRRIGVTSHNRRLAAEMAASGVLDLVMVRYNAAHRGAERDVFAVTTALGLPVVAYTATRWRRLFEPTPDDPKGFAVPPAPYWYRFALQHPAVSVVLCAPRTRNELDQDLELLETVQPLTPAEFARLAEHGARVRNHATYFP